MNYLEALNRRYSVKKFDTERQVAPEVLHNILQAGKLSASSLGLQPYKIYVAESAAIRRQLVPAFYNPSQAETCSHLLILTSKTKVEQEYIDGYFRHITEVRGTPGEQLQGFKASIEGWTEAQELEEQQHWAEKQSYIALANLMFAAALEGVDTCPMEGFREEVLSRVLQLNPENEKVSVTLALGYRSAEDAFQNMKKVRKPAEKLFKFL